MIERLLLLISEKVERHKILVLAIGISIGIISGLYTIKNCKINTNTEDLLSNKLEWRIDYEKFKSAFPNLTDNVLIVIESPIPESAQKTAEVLKNEIEENPEYFSFVSYPQGSEFFKKQALLYLEIDELQHLIDDLSRSQALLGLLSEKPNLETVLDIIQKMVEYEGERTPLSENRFLGMVDDSFKAHLKGQSLPISWRRLMSDEKLDQTRIFLLAKPNLNFQEVLPADKALSFLEKKILGLKPSVSAHVTISMTGSAALNHDELVSVTRGAQKIGLAALICVALILYIGLRSGSLILASLISLGTGLACTAGFATIAIGTLNMISIAFAVLYVGLAIDFAIHICLRYQEHCRDKEKREAINSTTLELGRSICLCAFTTSIGFLAFVPTDYKGVAELGLISGVGMILSLVINLTILPALLTLLPKPSSPKRKISVLSRYLDEGSHDVKIFIVAAVTGFLSLWLIQSLEFDNNPINLNNQAAPSVVTLKKLSDNGGSPTTSLSIIEARKEVVTRVTNILERDSIVERVTSALDLVPEDQNEKISLIEELGFIIGGEITLGETTTPSRTLVLEKIELVTSAIQTQAQLFQRGSPILNLQETLFELHNKISAATKKEAQKAIVKIESDILLYFPELIEFLSRGLDAEKFDLISIPKEIKHLWYNEEGLYRIEVRPAIDPFVDFQMKKFVETVRSVSDRNVTGMPIINLEAGNSVIYAFAQAMISALCLIFIVVWFALKKLSASLLIMTPIILSCLLTGGLTVILNIPLNFANIIALPLLLGIGIDSSIHIFHRHSISKTDFSFLRSSTSRGVIYSALTTAASFGSLAISPHSGTASLGLLLTLSLACIVVCSLGLLPALIRKTM